MSHRSTLDFLVEEGKVDARIGPFLDHAPAAIRPLDVDRVEGMLLGLAVGDALGNTSESQPPTRRLATYGEISDYLPNRYAGDRPVGLPSDDSQMAFWTLQQILEDGEVVPERLAEIFATRQIFGIGNTVSAFVRNYQGGMHWTDAGVRDGAGNGALMRIAPVLIPHLKEPSTDLWADVILATMVTHNGSAALGSCLAFVDLVWNLLSVEALPDPRSLTERAVGVMRAVETESGYTARFGMFEGQQPMPLSDYTEMCLQHAFANGLSTLDACDGWGSGAYLLETVPSVLYILAMHGDDPEAAIVRAVNDTRDNDTIGAIVGAAVGALHGRSGLPARWIDGLLGRTAADDDGHVFELIERTRTLLR